MSQFSRHPRCRGRSVNVRFFSFASPSLLSSLTSFNRAFDSFSRHIVKCNGESGEAFKTVIEWTDIFKRWMIGGTKGALSPYHIDGAGYRTWFRILKGAKHWFLVVPDENQVRPVSVYLNGNVPVKGIPLILVEGDEL